MDPIFKYFTYLIILLDTNLSTNQDRNQLTLIDTFTRLQKLQT